MIQTNEKANENILTPVTFPKFPCRQRRDEPPALVFAPLAWLKLQMFCHASDNEIGGFAVSAAGDPLYVERFETVLQGVTPVSVEFADSAVADHFDRCVDEGLVPQRFARIWCHTHPGESAEPSFTDEKTFERVFGPCDWSVMFILSRAGRTYARLAFAAGPGGSLMLPVIVDWAAWPDVLLDESLDLDRRVHAWREEFERNVHALDLRSTSSGPASLPPYSLLVGDDPLVERELWADEALELYQLEELDHATRERNP
jgi:hypothetical protein